MPRSQSVPARAAIAALALALAGCGAATPELAIKDAVYRPPLGAADVAVAYGVITSTQPDRIVSVSSPHARAVEMHETVSDGASSRMQRMESLALQPGESVVFSPGGRHFMVIGPDPLPLTGEPPATFPIQFEFESGKTQIVRFQAG